MHEWNQQREDHESRRPMIRTDIEAEFQQFRTLRDAHAHLQAKVDVARALEINVIERLTARLPAVNRRSLSSKASR